MTDSCLHVREILPSRLANHLPEVTQDILAILPRSLLLTYTRQGGVTTVWVAFKDIAIRNDLRIPVVSVQSIFLAIKRFPSVSNLSKDYKLNV